MLWFFFVCERNISYYSFRSIQKVTGLRFICAKSVWDKSCRETVSDMRLKFNILSCIRPCRDKLTTSGFMLCHFRTQEQMDWSWTKHYNAHSACFQLFKTKKSFLTIKTCTQQESAFTRVVELSLLFTIFVYCFFYHVRFLKSQFWKLSLSFCVFTFCILIYYRIRD
jgi:hypothetical protein